MKPKTFEQFLKANPYQNTRSFTKEDWESSMYEKWKDESKEVKEGVDISPTPWFIRENGYEVIMPKEGIYSVAVCNTIFRPMKVNAANAKAICTAINNTYGKGLNPEACLPMFNALSAILDGIKTKHKDLNFGSIKVLCETILENAKL